MFFPNSTEKLVLNWFYLMNGLLTSIIFFITLYSILKNSFNSNRHYQLVQLNILISAQLCDILIAVGEPVVCVPHLTILLLTPLQGPMPVGLAFMTIYFIILPYTLVSIFYSLFYRVFSLNLQNRKRRLDFYNKMLIIFFVIAIFGIQGIFWGAYSTGFLLNQNAITLTAELQSLEKYSLVYIFKENDLIRLICAFLGFTLTFFVVLFLGITAYFLFRYSRDRDLSKSRKTRDMQKQCIRVLSLQSLAAFVTIVLPYTLMIIIIARFPLPETIGGIAPAIAALHSLVNSCIILVTTRFNRRMVGSIGRSLVSTLQDSSHKTTPSNLKIYLTKTSRRLSEIYGKQRLFSI